MIVAATGHRPDKLGGHGPHIFGRLVPIACKYLRERPVKGGISGMALGWDQAFALACLSLEIPLTAVIVSGMERKWPSGAQAVYRTILRGAADVVVIPEPVKRLEFTDALNRRNRYMVDHCDRMAALWDGSAGGTNNCIKYARGRQREVDNLWPEYLNEIASVAETPTIPRR